MIRQARRTILVMFIAGAAGEMVYSSPWDSIDPVCCRSVKD